MKGKLRLLSVLSAVTMLASTGLTACGTNEVEEHDHVWNSGEITTEPTCHSEGVKTYTCTVENCGQTKTVPISMTEHNWDNGVVTTEPTCHSEGVKKFTCQNEGCGKEKEEPVDELEHRWDDGVLNSVPDFFNKGEKKFTCLNDGCVATKTEAVEAHADFAEQYYSSLTEQTNWQYGYANDYDQNSGAIDFVRITETDVTTGTWKAEGIEVGKGYVYSENNAVISYTFTESVPELTQADVSIAFSGEESNTALNTYLIVTDRDGLLVDSQELNSAGAKDWTYKSAQAIDVEQGYVFSLVFENVGQGKAGGNLSFTLTAPCIHVWDDGVVKTAATCQTEGTIEYTCLNCSAKRDGVIEKTDHNWDGGEQTKAPTETEEGEMTFHCQNTEAGCHETKTESIPKLAPSTFNGADFVKDFSATAQPSWKYGYTTNYNFDNNTFTFNEAKPVGDAWMDNGGGVEIKGGWLKNETDGSMAVIRYIMPETREITVAMTFTGSDAATRMSARLHVTNASGNLDGNIQDNPTFVYDENSNGWSLNKTMTVEKGGTISVIFTREGDKGWYHGSFNMTLTANGQAAEEYDLADFGEDFHDNKVSNSIWEYGRADYAWDGSKTIKANEAGNESFDFIPATEYDEVNASWKTDGVEIKNDWILTDGTAAIVYTVGVNAEIKLNLTFTSDNTYLAARITIVDASGNWRANMDTFGVGSTTKTEWQMTSGDISVKAGDKIYLMFFKEGSSEGNSGHITYKITAKGNGQQLGPENVITNFADDFNATLAGTSNWEVGVVDYKFPEETFTFTKITGKNDGGDAFTDNTEDKWKEIKGDWAAINGMVAFRYKFVNAANAHVDFHIKGTGNNQYNIRWAITDGAGNVKNADNKPAWVNGGNDVTLSTDVTAAANDLLYIFIERNPDIDGDQCNYTLVITGDEQSSVTPFEGANFADDFSATLAGTSNWQVGVVDYKFDPVESFTFTQITNKNDGGDAFTDNTDGWKEMKGDWAAINGTAALAYRFDSAASVHVDFRIKGTGSNEYRIRWAIVDSEGHVKNSDNKPAWAGEGNEVTLSTDITAAANDTLYIFIERNSDIDGDQCNYTLSLSPKE